MNAYPEPDLDLPDSYYCVICGKELLADSHGVIVHDPVPHPPDMTFDEEEKPQ